jgi:ABC-type iron transport system FetAB permease component
MTVKTWTDLPSQGLISRRLLAVLWLFIIGFVLVNTFQSTRVVFSLGLLWVTLGLIASVVDSRLNPTAFDLIARRSWLRNRAIDSAEDY